MATYTVQSGDSLSSIAQRYTGDPSRWPELAAANPAIADPNVIAVGQVVTLPTAWAPAPVASSGTMPAIAPSSSGGVWGWVQAHKGTLALALLAVAGLAWWLTRPSDEGERQPARRRRRGRSK